MLKIIQMTAMIAVWLLNQTGGDIRDRVIGDETLIIPGYGAEKIILNENVSQLNASYKGQEYRLVKLKDELNIFQSIYKVNVNLGIVFNEIRYYYHKNAVAFIKNNSIQAVAGLKTDRITADAVDLQQGADNFIYCYGNESLQTFKDAVGCIYIYPKRGIAVFDDNNDDSIDLYMVFPPTKK